MIFYNTDENKETVVDQKTIIQIIAHKDFRYQMAGPDSIKNVYIFSGSENDLSLSRTYQVNLLCNYDMMYYPFDSQVCYIEMITKGNNDHLVDLVPHQLDFLGPQELSQYFVRGFQQCNSVQRGKKSLRVEVLLGRRLLGNALTVFLPTALLTVIGHLTNYFKPFFFEAVISVNLTVMLVLATMFLSVSATLPATSYVKMVDIWMLFNLFIPFIEVFLHTYIDQLRDDEGEVKEVNSHGKSRKIEPITTIQVSINEMIQQDALREHYNRKNINQKKLKFASMISLRLTPTIAAIFFGTFWIFGLSLYFFPRELGAINPTCN
ncbi:gamma-aminobutyric acid receptor subunit rho-3 isoform X2 [Eurytemora carolleeae]|uniref:gamma-aminobutyric acid receptor subunit rho-3 isoform X2 n=1 Tax=Eurytemora carolleeae TaxID=1294199 RepID=UPI000C771A06|nr:gamma-aminobutyric acid receptor subunit rho-3 isoform X2 [Eurytemora carolleeae]|eukprot:XP_023337393.1 gamma-aminobutyric acid receptor subunit rho-3-like isoform X2 [Eurytemora affinis]